MPPQFFLGHGADPDVRDQVSQPPAFRQDRSHMILSPAPLHPAAAAAVDVTVGRGGLRTSSLPAPAQQPSPLDAPPGSYLDTRDEEILRLRGQRIRPRRSATLSPAACEAHAATATTLERVCAQL